MLHYVSDDEKLTEHEPWNITTAAFDQLLNYLEAEGYHTVTFEDIERGNRYEKEIIITFDDCPKHLWDYAIPELQKRNMKAVFYLLGGHIGGYNYWNTESGLSRIDLMDAEQIAKLSEVGMEVGSHGYHHVMMEELSVEEATEQITKSKEKLEGIINKEILSIVYPYGSLPPKYNMLVPQAGYKYGLSVYTPWESKYAIRRWLYDNTDTLSTLKEKLSSNYGLYRSFADKWRIWKPALLRAMYKKYSKLKSAFK